MGIGRVTMIKWESAGDDEIVCYCRNVNKKTIVAAIEEGQTSLTQIKEATSACTMGNCKELNPSGKCCSGDIQELINLYTPEDGGSPSGSCCCCNS